MPKEEWGVKRVCPTTGKRFYDLNRDPIVSPYTGEEVKLDDTKSRLIQADGEDLSVRTATETDVSDDDVVLDDDDMDVEIDEEDNHLWQQNYLPSMTDPKVYHASTIIINYKISISPKNQLDHNIIDWLGFCCSMQARKRTRGGSSPDEQIFGFGRQAWRAKNILSRSYQ